MASLVVPYYATKQRIVDAYEWMENDQDVEVDTLKVSLLCAVSKQNPSFRLRFAIIIITCLCSDQQKPHPVSC